MKKIVKGIINKLSTIEFDLTQNYKIQRKFYEIVHFHYLGFLNKSTDNEILVNDHKVKIRIFFPNKDSNKVIFYFHGGGWVIGNVDTYNKVCTRLAKKTGCLVISVDYRLAPEYPFPSAIEDCYGVLKELIVNKKIIDSNFEEIILMGDSAGGNLAAVTSLMTLEKKEFTINKQILLYPVTHYDHSENSKFQSVKDNGNDWLLTNKNMEAYFNLYVKDKKDLSNKYVSPFLADDLSNQPKTLIIVSEFDPLKDEGIAYGEKLKEFKNSVETHIIKDSIHGFFNYSIFKDKIEETYKYINEFLKK